MFAPATAGLPTGLSGFLTALSGFAAGALRPVQPAQRHNDRQAVPPPLLQAATQLLAVGDSSAAEQAHPAVGLQAGDACDAAEGIG